MCDSNIYTRYRCADPVTGLCVCDTQGPYASKKGCENSWQCHLNQFDIAYEHKPLVPNFPDRRSFPASGGSQVTGKVQSSSVRIVEPSFYVQ